MDTVDHEGLDLSGASARRVDLSGATAEQVRLRGARLRSADLSGMLLRDVLLADVRVRGAYVEGLEVSGEIGRLVVNGVDVAPLVVAELDRTAPGHADIRPTDAEGFRHAWDVLEDLWAGTVERARRLDPALLHERVDGEWSFVDTLRHLSFATECWLLRAVQGDPAPWDPLSLPWEEAPTPRRSRPTATPGPTSTWRSPCAATAPTGSGRTSRRSPTTTSPATPCRSTRRAGPSRRPSRCASVC